MDFERLVDRLAIANEARDLLERRNAATLVDAEYLLAPRVTLINEQQRIVRVVNAPEEARRDPPRILAHRYTDTLTKPRVVPVGRYRTRPNPRDVDYRVAKIAAGDDLLALLRDEVEPSVIVRRFSNGHTDLLTAFDV